MLQTTLYRKLQAFYGKTISKRTIKMKESFGHNKISFDDFVRMKNLGPKTAQRFKQFLQDKCGCADEVNEATLYRAYDNFRMHVADNNFFYPEDKINLEESFGDKFAIVIKEEYITDFVEKCSDTWNDLKKDGYDVGVKEPNWLAIPAVPGIFNEYFYCKFIINPNTKTVKYSVKVDKHNEVVLNESIEDFDSKYHRSYKFAKDKHDATGAVRKFSGAPYIVHPDGVAKIVDAYGGDDDQVRAALAHDCLEDCDCTYEDIVEYFGKKAANIVKLITNDPEEVKRIGKEKYISNELLHLPHKALLVKLADMLYNFYDHCPESQAARIVNNMIALSKRKDLTEPERDLIDDIMTRAAVAV